MKKNEDRKTFRGVLVEDVLLNVELNKSRSINRQLLIALTLLVFTIIIITSISMYKIEVTKIERDYYEDQMISFCEIAEFYNDKNYPEMYPCEKWVVGK